MYRGGWSTLLKKLNFRYCDSLPWFMSGHIFTKLQTLAAHWLSLTGKGGRGTTSQELMCWPFLVWTVHVDWLSQARPAHANCRENSVTITTSQAFTLRSSPVLELIKTWILSTTFCAGKCPTLKASRPFLWRVVVESINSVEIFV